MRTTRIATIAIAPLLAAALTLPLTTSQATAAPPQGAPSEDSATTSTSDSLTTKWREKYEAQRDIALQQRLRTGGKGATEKLAKGVYGKVAETGGDRIFVVLAEFGNTRHSAFPDSAGDATTYDGPLHNEIPKPDRAKDNSHGVAQGLQPRALREHLLQPDAEVLRGAVQRALHLQR